MGSHEGEEDGLPNPYGVNDRSYVFEGGEAEFLLVLLINDKTHDLNGARDDDDGYVLEVVGTKIFFILPQE